MTVYIYLDAAAKWRWRAVAFNQLIIADSGQGYASQSNAKRAWKRFAALAGAGDARVVWMSS